ncbi:hypothetical protein AYI70_g7950 [Smittium culicis]|uniref:Reverse transcriptase RNase H-like domain-containing protein n=1 Tax=Smittium culicis TaxID=133412 RepID=A0A1R1XI92_9FUNG|nr:hypothetical protein AYI70_g7950 [Smittium culicis]
MLYLTNRAARYVIRQLIIPGVDWMNQKRSPRCRYGFYKVHHYVYGSCTELHTDHCALITSLENEDPRGRIARWNSALQAYDYTIRHIKSLDNGLTGALSRDFLDEEGDVREINIITRSQGPPKRTIRRLGKLDVLSCDSDEFDYSDNDSLSDENLNILDDDNQSQNENFESIVDMPQTQQIPNSSTLPTKETHLRHQNLDEKSNIIISTIQDVSPISSQDSDIFTRPMNSRDNQLSNDISFNVIEQLEHEVMTSSNSIG